MTTTTKTQPHYLLTSLNRCITDGRFGDAVRIAESLSQAGLYVDKGSVTRTKTLDTHPSLQGLRDRIEILES